MRLLDLVFDGFLHHDRLLVHLPVSFVEAGEENLIEGGVCRADDDLNGGDEEVKPTNCRAKRARLLSSRRSPRSMRGEACPQGPLPSGLLPFSQPPLLHCSLVPVCKSRQW